MFPAIFFFSTGFMETLCLSSPGIPAGACPSFGAYQVLPSSWRGDTQTLLLKTCLRQGKKNTLFCRLKVCFPWRGLTLFSHSSLGSFVGFLLFCYRVLGVFKLSLVGGSLELSMKAIICFLAEFPKEMKLLLLLAWLSVSFLCVQVGQISILPAHPSQIQQEQRSLGPASIPRTGSWNKQETPHAVEATAANTDITEHRRIYIYEWQKIVFINCSACFSSPFLMNRMARLYKMLKGPCVHHLFNGLQ